MATNRSNMNRSLDPKLFYNSLRQRMENRLLSKEDTQLPEWTKVLYPEYWPDNVEKNVSFGEIEVESLCKRLRIPERQVLRGYREFLTKKKMPATLLVLVNTINSIPISTAEYERGFSQMNLILTPTRASLQIKTLSTLMFIKHAFRPLSYVNSWFLKGRHLATDTKSKERAREDSSTSVMSFVWNLF
ncbi:hypothetical protein ANN_24752 [Periplaneta americana]|uniref:HAT C-terminal dimerisation domain-containing protein n=1 Tax=Periplaneta americana TaxID=6978 RepID=A0ABQ8RZH2_PERAM|nr:hypothetical protein ANN_24752 [Periplaneta americana]